MQDISETPVEARGDYDDPSIWVQIDDIRPRPKHEDRKGEPVYARDPEKFRTAKTEVIPKKEASGQMGETMTNQ